VSLTHRSVTIGTAFSKTASVITETPMTALERRTVSSLALLYGIRMLGLFMVLPLLALYAADIPGASPTLIGLALGAYGLSQALLQIPFGWLSDRVGRKPVIVAGLIVFALGSIVAAGAETVYGIVLGRAMQGAGAIAGTVMALVADLTRDEQRTKAMALVGVSIGISFALALIVGPLVAAWGGLTAVFYFTALLAVAGIAITWLLVPSPEASGAIKGTQGTDLASLARSFRNPALAQLNLGIFVLHFILMACFLAVPALLEVVAGVAREHHWQVYLPVLTLSIIGMLPMMRLAERDGRSREMFAIGIALVLLSIGVLAYARGAILFYLGMWLFFVGFNYLEANLPSLVSKTATAEHRGAAMGVYSSCQFCGAFAGGAGGGWVLQYAGLEALFVLCMALAALWLWTAWSRPPQAAQP
jgi:MFS family permease